jgi:hypothetical protein
MSDSDKRSNLQYCIFNHYRGIFSIGEMSDLMNQIRETATTVPDKKDRVEFVLGTIRGKRVERIRQSVESLNLKIGMKRQKDPFFCSNFSLSAKDSFRPTNSTSSLRV